MKIKSLYILLSTLAISFLFAVMGYLYLDGKKSLLKEDIQYKSQVDDNLAFLEFISHIKRISEVDTDQKESLERSFLIVEKEIDNVSFGLFNINQSDRLQLKKHIEKLKDTLVYKIEYMSAISQIENELNQSWKDVESLLQKKIQQRINNGKDFLPGVKKTLSDWGKDVPLFEKIKRSIDVSYVDKDKFGQLQELIFFSRDLLDSKSKTESPETVLYDEFKTVSEKLLNLNVEKKFQERMLEKIRYFFKKVEENRNAQKKKEEIEQEVLRQKEALNRWVKEELMAQWHAFNLDVYQRNINEATKRYDIVLKSSIFVSMFVFVVLMILFLKIFPYLDKLEKNAHSISSGDFQKRFSNIPNNEIGKVMTAFNTMAKEIEDYITKLKKEEKNKVELIDAIQKMKRSNEIGELTSKIAHEIKNPLSILSFCLEDAYEAIKKAKKDETEKEIEKALQALERLVSLVSKLGTKAQQSKLEDIDVDQMLQELISMYRGVVERESIHLELVSQLNDVEIRGAKLEILSALTNLIDNSVDYLKEAEVKEKSIEISASVSDGNVEISIKNHGEKIEDSKLLFTSFYSSKEGEARGLGLTIVKDIATQMGGDIHYDYKNGLNVFTLTLPIKS